MEEDEECFHDQETGMIFVIVPNTPMGTLQNNEREPGPNEFKPHKQRN